MDRARDVARFLIWCADLTVPIDQLHLGDLVVFVRTDGEEQEFADWIRHLASPQGHVIYMDCVVKERRR